MVRRRLWLDPGKQNGVGHGRRKDLRCSLFKCGSSPWGAQPLWARVVAFHFANWNGLTLAEFQRKRPGLELSVVT